MGKITEALKRVTDERISRIQKKPQIPYVVRKVDNTKIDEHVVYFHDPTSPIAEQYNIVRTNIQSLKSAKDCKEFLITSSIIGEGKTVTAINLAMAMAQDLNNKSVLLVDADMRKGKIAEYLGLKRSPGLSELLKDGAMLDSALVSPNINNLTILPSGNVPKNPSELLGSKRMQGLIASFKNRFDYILIDSPPVMPLSDACILGPMADKVILIVQAGRTQRGVVAHAQARLHQTGAKMLGFILSNVEYHLPQYLYRYIQGYSEYKYVVNGEENRGGD